MWCTEETAQEEGDGVVVLMLCGVVEKPGILGKEFLGNKQVVGA